MAEPLGRAWLGLAGPPLGEGPLCPPQSALRWGEREMEQVGCRVHHFLGTAYPPYRPANPLLLSLREAYPFPLTSRNVGL